MKKISNFFLLIGLINISSLLCSCGNSNNINQITSKDDFVGITFNDASFEYDGYNHSIFCENVPEFANVTYNGNNQSEVGYYTVTALITAQNYNSLTLTATLTIYDRQADFTGISFQNQSFEYDGEYHSIYVTGAPDFATVTYQNNDKKEIGSYLVKATVEAENYRTKVLSAYLYITERTFKNITFSNQTFAYDGEYHSIYVTGAPDFATVTYQNNDKRELGTYSVTATISATGYKTLKLTATMTIANILPEAILSNRTLIYNGRDQLITYELPKLSNAVLNYLDEEFYVDGKKVDKNSFRVKTIGTHTVQVKLKCDRYDYQPSIATATIKVVENECGVDSSKTPFRITNNLKFKELRNEILKGNFTIYQQVADEYFYPNDTTKLVESSSTTTYVTINEAFKIYDYNELLTHDDYFTETTYSHYKIINNDVFINEFNSGILDIDYCYKFPASSYRENIIGRIGLSVMSCLNESNDGGFEDGKQGGYTTSYGHCYIDEENNTFTLEKRWHYFHPEFDHDEITYITISNIGNTIVNVDPYLNVSNSNYELFEEGSYCINGFEYSNGTLDITFDSVDVVYNERKEYIIPAEINGTIIKKYTEDYYHRYYDLDLTGFTFKCYINSSGYYKGQYESFGFVSGSSYLYRLEESGAEVLYYGEW